MMQLNCDLGEGFGTWQLGHDAAIMPFIDQANIACGFHASDPLTMQKTVALAIKHQVNIGAHPAYPDLVGFGRRSMQVAPQELKAIVQYQIGALNSLCHAQGTRVKYVKPHGALYNDMMKDDATFRVLCSAIAELNYDIPLMIQATPTPATYKKIAKELGVALLFEAFADRHYQDNGLLVPRSQKNALISNTGTVVSRIQQLVTTGTLESENGLPISLHVDTLCVHGDTLNAVELVKQLAHALGRKQP